MKNKISYLEGLIEGFKDIIEIRNSSGIYNVSPTELDKDKAYLKGLEDAYNIIKGDNYGK